MDQEYRYDLAFVAPEESQQGIPEIVLVINKASFQELCTRLQNFEKTFSAKAFLYIGEKTDFWIPEEDIFGNKTFGYGRQGYCTNEGDEIWFRLQLRSNRYLLKCVYTFCLLISALEMPFESVNVGTCIQDVHFTSVMTRNYDQSVGYGHAVSGYLSTRMINWIELRAKHFGEAMCPEVLHAMRSVWKSICPAGYQKVAFDVDGRIREGGSFRLSCFGEACDLSVYPDGLGSKSLGFVELSCHNLDTAEQQLTLLSGLAKLCELSRA